MTPDLRFQTPVATLTQREITGNVAALDLPDGWTRADDVELVEGLFLGLGMGRIAVRMGRTLREVSDRFLDLRNAAMGGAPRFTLTMQERLLKAVREVA